jgi:2-hydroxychromene-2-carboxylate isomerase
VAERVFYFDLGSPYAYLTAERIDALLPGVEWQPILVGALFKRNAYTSWGLGPERAANLEIIAARAVRHGLPPVRVHDRWPGDMLAAMRVATWAAGTGQGRAFALAAFRRAFVHGEDLSEPERLLAAVDDAGLDLEAATAGATDPATKARLRAATEAAWERGVRGVPTVALDGRLVFGDDRLDDAARAARPA